MKRPLKIFLSTATLLALSIFQPLYADIQNRIVGGTTVSISDFPSIVALLDVAVLTATGSAFQAQFCGGTLIQSSWVITAAHCVVRHDGTLITPAKISVLAGSGDLKNPITQPTSVARIIIHERYNNLFVNNDIALLKLAAPAPAPAIALVESQVLTNDYAYIAGWGRLKYVENANDARYPKSLQASSVLFISGNECAKRGGLYDAIDTETQICAGLKNGGVDSCQGDSGGPIFSVTKQNTLRLAGITSWGYKCARPNKPGVYTNVLSYIEWISKNINSTPLQPTQPIVIDGPTQPFSEPTNQNRERLAVSGSSGLFFLLMLFVILGFRRASHTANLLK